MLKRTEVILALCKRYNINAAEGSETLSIALDNKAYHMYEELRTLKGRGGLND